MTDGDVPPPPVPEVPIPASAPAPAPEPGVVPESAIQEISAEITGAVKDAVMGKPGSAEPTPPSQEVLSKPAPSAAPASAAPPSEIPIVARREAALEKRREIKSERLEKIVHLAAQKDSFGNDDVENMLLIADSTTRSYLSELVRSGRLSRSGKGKGTRYRRV